MAGKKTNLTDQLKKYFGFDTFKGNQEAIKGEITIPVPSINKEGNW